MSVLIKGMEMPKGCDVCPLIAEADDYHVCCINEQFIPWEWIDEHSAEQRHPKPSWCPLVEIPPHGRLIDADALIKDGWTLRKEAIRMGGYVTHELPLNNPSIPTIIEAEGER